MKRISKPLTGHKTALSMVIALTSIGSQAVANTGDNVITLIEIGDLHGTLVSHQAVLKHTNSTEYNVEASGGLAKLKTVVNGIRTDNPDAVLLSVGDLTHGSAEAMFTVVDAMMAPINAFAIDVYTG